MFEFGITPVLGAAVMMVLEFFMPIIAWRFPEKGPLRTLVVRLLAFVIGALLLMFGDEYSGLIASDPFLSQFPDWLAVTAGALSVSFWSGISVYAFRAAHGAARKLNNTGAGG